MNAGQPAFDALAPNPTGTLQVGLYGGTFDPVHLGHVAVAKAATQQLRLNELLWVPAGSPWQKRVPVASAAHRVAMLALVMPEANAVSMGQGAAPASWRIDDRELKRGGPSYTIDTVQALLAERASVRLWLIVGADQYSRLHTWHRHEALLRMVSLAVVPRDGAGVDPTPAVIAAGVVVHPLTMAAVDVSSTTIRARLGAGQGVEGLVSASVARYIDHHGLYLTP
jgi:nicotinate-nucleotide adenylyltransferase